MTVSAKEHAGKGYRVFCNGADVTEQCFFADDVHGVVHRFATNANGKPFVDPKTGRATVEILHGAVRIVAPTN